MTSHIGGRCHVRTPKLLNYKTGMLYTAMIFYEMRPSVDTGNTVAHARSPLNVTSCHVTPRRGMARDSTSCHVKQFYDTSLDVPPHAMPHYTTSSQFTSCSPHVHHMNMSHVTSSRVTLRLAMSCRFKSRHVTSLHSMPRHSTACHIPSFSQRQHKSSHFMARHFTSPYAMPTPRRVSSRLVGSEITPNRYV